MALVSLILVFHIQRKLAGIVQQGRQHNRPTTYLAVFDVSGAGISGVNKDLDTLATIGTINLLFC